MVVLWLSGKALVLIDKVTPHWPISPKWPVLCRVGR